MIRFTLFFTFILLVHSASSSAQNTCYRGSWELDAAYTFQNGVIGGSGDSTPMSSMPVDFIMATGSAFLTIGNEGDFTYTFDSWSVTFRGNDNSPIRTEVQVNLHGDVWGRYTEADNEALTMFMSGSEVPEPDLDVSSVITVAGQSMDGPSGFESLFGPQTFLLEYRCEGEFLYVNGESAGGFFSNSRYMQVN